MKKTMKLHVLMAGDYDIAGGARIDFHLDEEKQIYIASCEGKSFGIAKTVLSGEKEDLEGLGKDFSGIVLGTDIAQHLLEVKIVTGRGGK